jgi:hypothetical protein
MRKQLNADIFKNNVFVCTFFCNKWRAVRSISSQPWLFKVLCHQLNIFLKALQLNQYFMYIHKWFLYFMFYILEKVNMKFSLASLKTRPNSKKMFLSCIKFLFRLSFAFIGRFFPGHIHSRFLEYLKIVKTKSAH